VRTADLKNIAADGWRCARCAVPLVSMPVDVTYMGSSFNVDLPCCPACGFTFIPPELAHGKMEEAEKILEDK
jgi:hypothetical protein